MKIFMLSLLALVSIALASCNQETQRENLVSPVLEAGQCELKGSGYATEQLAKDGQKYILEILLNTTVGDQKLKIVKINTYSTPSGNQWNYQVVFNCEDAAIVHDFHSGYATESERDAAFSALYVTYAADPAKKIISHYKGTYEINCSTCYDYYDDPYDCFCDTAYDFNIDYVKIINSGFQKPMIQFHDFVKAGYSALGKNATLADTLAVVDRYFPLNSADAKRVQGWKVLVNKLRTCKEPSRHR